MFPTRLAARLPLQLSPDQCDAYTEVAYGVRDQAIELYEAYLARTTDPQAPAFDPQEWKLLKQKFDPHDWKLFRQKEQFQILVSRQKQQPTVYRAPGMYQSDVHKHIHESAEWHPQSALRTVGSFACSVEDALYGSAVPTEKVMMVKSLAVHDHFIDHKSLCDITIPTDDEPFTHVGLKWSARPPYLATMVRPRDTTFVHAAGFCTVNFKGQQSRAGFHVYHSIENNPGVPEFTELSFRRFRFSLCIIYLPGDAGVLNVFASMASDAGGDLPRRLTTMFTATALASIYNAADNALRKKLAALRSDTAKADMRIPSMASTLGETPTGDCPLCSRRPSVLHPLKRCGVCRKSVCSRCVTTRTLVLGHTKASLRPTNVAICSGCLTIASNLDVRELAIQEFVRPFDPDYVESLPSTQSISTDVSGSFFGDRHNSTAFLSIAGSDSESDRYSDDQPSMWGPASLSR